MYVWKLVWLCGGRCGAGGHNPEEGGPTGSARAAALLSRAPSPHYRSTPRCVHWITMETPLSVYGSADSSWLHLHPPPPNFSRRIKLYCLYVYGNGPKLSSVSLPRLCECGLRTFRSNVPSSVRKMASVVSSKRWCTFLPGHMTLIDINVVFLLQMCLFFISLIV